MEGKYGRLRQVSVSAEGGETKIVDVYAKWNDDEPLFLIRGQDLLACDVLEFYADCARSRGREAVAQSVEDWVAIISAWQDSHPTQTKLPD